ncbi:hypothetical protein JFT58_06440 [Pseudomonas sp. MF6767]|uniref:hypothetical protein n=1 Tax=Pseudomonas sp. MF6767 TaxID=2797531 RepID=UPI0018E74A5E|nr:hypothetical protein [Pseudomonas sp. MF6767]MBJ2277918.1 hypothetical protein [Pseudomonas sp. MF6767]
MIKISLLTIALFASMSANAAYKIYIPIEAKLGGSLPDNTLAWVGVPDGGVVGGGNGSNPTTPEEPAKPEEPTRESMCASAKQDVISIAASQNLDVTVKYISPLINDKCVLMVMSIGKFTNKAALINFGNSVARLNISNYSIGVERYSSSIVDMFISSLTTDVSTQADKIWSRYQTDKK